MGSGRSELRDTALDGLRVYVEHVCRWASKQFRNSQCRFPWLKRIHCSPFFDSKPSSRNVKFEQSGCAVPNLAYH